MFSLDGAARRIEEFVRVLHVPDKSDGLSEAQTAYYAFLTEQKGDDIAEIVFHRLHGDETQKMVIEALILGGCPPEEAERALKVPIRAYEWHRELFFDTTCFLTVLDRIAYLDSIDNDEERQLKLRAVDLGYEYVLYVYAHVIPETDRQFELLRRMYMSTAYKALTMNYAGMGGTITKHAIEHARLMLQAFSAMERSRPENTGQSEALIRIVTEPVRKEEPEIQANDII